MQRSVRAIARLVWEVASGTLPKKEGDPPPTSTLASIPLGGREKEPVVPYLAGNCMHFHTTEWGGIPSPLFLNTFANFPSKPEYCLEGREVPVRPLWVRGGSLPTSPPIHFEVCDGSPSPLKYRSNDEAGRAMFFGGGLVVGIPMAPDAKVWAFTLSGSWIPEGSRPVPLCTHRVRRRQFPGGSYENIRGAASIQTGVASSLFTPHPQFFR